MKKAFVKLDAKIALGMKHYLIFIALLLYSLSICAQKDSTVLQVTYKATFEKSDQSDSIATDIERLDIGRYSSKYYSLVGDYNKRKILGLISPNEPQYSGTISRYEIYKNMPQKGMMEYVHSPFGITVKDSIDNLFAWNLSDEDSIICEYPCKKAETTFRGRKWTVWYSIDLPYNDGPWKFCGLPGLVLSAKDATGNFSFSCIGIEKGDLHPIVYNKSKRRYVTPQKAAELREFEIKDNSAYYSYMLDGIIKTNDPPEIDKKKNKLRDAGGPSLEIF